MAASTIRKKHGRNHPSEAVFTAPQLPHEIIVEIISRLPVKSLCTFKCVSKLWLSTISSPQFAKTHLDLAFKNNILKQKLLYWADEQVCRIDWESVSAADDVIDKGLVADVLDNSLKDHPCLLTFRTVLCSSNGLVCVVDKDRQTVLVINPCTGEYRRVLVGPQEDGAWYSLVYGFGYSSESDDYKLVIMNSQIINMYSLRSCTWTKFTPPLNYEFPLESTVSGVPLNGALHLIGSVTADGCHEKVVCFDLEEKTFREMPLPSPPFQGVFSTFLGVINGCLCVHHWRGTDDYSVWVMHEYNNGESWTKISTSCVPLDTSSLTKERVNIRKVHQEIHLCNFENGTHGIPTGGNFPVGTYVESLIPPNYYVGK